MERHMFKLIFALVFVAILSGCAAVTQPLVIAHRGASGYLPEHTLEAATLAFQQGADFIEQDLVLSKDDIPVVLHDIHLDTVTDVKTKYPLRHRKDGRFYAIDFTLAELKTLRVHERQTLKGQQVYPNRYQGSSHFTIATFEEQIELIQQLNRQFNKNVGFYPEIKSPAWHQTQDKDISKIVFKLLRKHQLDDKNKAIYVQCFDFAELKRIRQELKANVKLIQLIGENNWNESTTDYDHLKTAQGLTEIANVAQGIGPWIPQIIDVKTQTTTTLVPNAHQAGLAVHPYTFRVDQLPNNMTKTQALTLLFQQLKIDGIFSDFPDVVVRYNQAQQ